MTQTLRSNIIQPVANIAQHEQSARPATRKELNKMIASNVSAIATKPVVATKPTTKPTTKSAAKTAKPKTAKILTHAERSAIATLAAYKAHNHPTFVKIRTATAKAAKMSLKDYTRELKQARPKQFRNI